MYRLVFCDLDGTVATLDGKVRPVVREAMQAVVDAGAWITISTGRGYQTLRPFLSQVVVNAPLICCNGGLIVEPTTRQVLHVNPMPLSLAHDLVRLAQEEGLAIFVYLDDLETTLDNCAGDLRFVLRRDGVAVRQVADPVAELKRPPHKTIFVADSPQAAAHELVRVQRYVGDRAQVLASSPKIVEVITPGITKARAMSWVSMHLGVDRADTIAIGDGDNDVEMMEWAALGVAMANATPAVQAAADRIAPSVEEDGVAVALRQFVLRESGSDIPS